MKSSSQVQPAETSSRLLKATSELRELSRVMKAPSPQEVDPRVLHDFREAMDHVRLTSWAAQQWLYQYRLDGNPETALSILTAERIRRATQLNFELSEDLEEQEEPLDRHRLEKLYAAVERLYTQLHLSLGKERKPAN